MDVIVTWEAAEPEDARLVSVLQAAARATMKAERMPGDVQVGIVVVDDATIRDLNARYRDVDEATDVLSFPQWTADELTALKENPESIVPRPLLLGDVVISAATARRQAETYEHGPEREFAFLCVHGVLHLLGYEHDDETATERMRAREEAVLAAGGWTRRRGGNNDAR